MGNNEAAPETEVMRGPEVSAQTESSEKIIGITERDLRAKSKEKNA